MLVYRITKYLFKAYVEQTPHLYYLLYILIYMLTFYLLYFYKICLHSRYNVVYLNLFKFIKILQTLHCVSYFMIL